MPTSDQVLGAAIFGAGWVAGEHAKAYQACPRTRLVAVGSRKEESARKCAQAAGAPDAFITTDFSALLSRPDIDIISITTPPDSHPDLTIRAARAGKHVCLEKPIALDWRSCLEMQKVVRESKVKTVVSFVLHWNPSLMNTRNLIEQGAIGQPYYIEVDYWHGMKKWYPQYLWSVTREQGGSSLLSAGCHAVDALRWFAGNDNDIVEVNALNVPHRGDNPDWQYDPTTLMTVRFKDGAIGKTASILDCKMPYQFNIDVVGTRGTIRDNRLWSENLLPGQTNWATIPTVLPDSGDVTHHPFNGQIEALVAGILDGAPVLPDLDDAVKTHEVIFAADRSAQEKRPIQLPLDR
ncbi:MAG TPA: Gfo/Idh/MocA family oxidoreductase [Tepidisphaeraceae bacterium]|jgi:predicted dehydrogenase